jgi:hypothetical protein
MRPVSIHAFVDESFREGRYLVTAALVDPGDLRRLRTIMRGLLLPGQRHLSCKLEKAPRRRVLVDQVVAAGVQATVYVAACSPKGQELARQACLARLVHDLMAAGALRLVLDSRGERDRLDVRVLQRALAPHPSSSHLVYEHAYSRVEPLIWVADISGWAFGAGGEWRRRIAPAVAKVIDCT